MSRLRPEKGRGSEGSWLTGLYRIVYLLVLGFLVLTGFLVHSPRFGLTPMLTETVHTSLNYVVVALIGMQVYFRILGVYLGPARAGVWSRRALTGLWLVVLLPEVLVATSLFAGSRPFLTPLESVFGGLGGLRLGHYLLTWLLFCIFSVYIYFSLLPYFPRLKKLHSGALLETDYR